MLVTIEPIRIGKNDNDYADFLRSLSAHASSKDVYEVLDTEDGFKELKAAYADRIDFVETPSPQSEVTISIPDNVLVLGRDWDKYVGYALEHGGIIDSDFIKKRFNIVGRYGEEGFEHIGSRKAVATA